MKRRLLSAAVALACVAPAGAIVNIERLRLEEPPPGWSGQIEWSLSGRSGNSDYQLLDTSLRVDWHRAPHTAFLILERFHGESEGETNADNAFAHLRLVRQLTPTLAGEIFGQVQQDDFRRLELRQLTGGGARLRLHTTPGESALYLGLGGFLYEEQVRAEGTWPEFTEQAVRISSYLAYKYRFSDQMEAVSTTYYQPRPDYPRDYRALEQATLNLHLTRRLDLRLTVNAIHDSEPPGGVEATDVTYTTSFAYRF